MGATAGTAVQATGSNFLPGDVVQLLFNGVTIQRTLIDGITDIVAGRRPISDYDQLV
jgi:hypothetical protein